MISLLQKTRAGLVRTLEVGVVIVMGLLVLDVLDIGQGKKA